MNSFRLVACPLAVILHFIGSAGAQPVLSDDFNDNSANVSLWTVLVRGAGPTIAETNQRVEINIPFNSANEPIQGVFSAEYNSRCTLAGDYDVQVDFILLEWPFSSGVRLGLLDNSIGAMMRASLGNAIDFPGQPRECYVRDLGGVTGFTTTGDTVGRLRLVKVGTVVTPYYSTAGGWVPLPAGTSSASTTSIRLMAWSHDFAFTDQPVRLAFDNFLVNQGQVNCPDDDFDGYPANLDCDDQDACTHPEASEICDLSDNDCDGVVDQGTLVVPGPISHLVVSHASPDPSVAFLSWSACGGGSTYDVVKGDLAAILASGGDFSQSVTECLENDSSDTNVLDPSVPPLGGGFIYLIRGTGTCGVGTYDSGAPSQIGLRDAEILASGNDCP